MDEYIEYDCDRCGAEINVRIVTIDGECVCDLCYAEIQSGIE